MNKPFRDFVQDRYAEGAGVRVDALCCPVSYDPKYLDIIPQEVIDRDYGCGDPSSYVRPGDTVLDLGSGGGKICFIASQIVGPEGRVIGVDMTPEMLALARDSAPKVAERLGYGNVEFRRGRIEDLATDLDQVDAWLKDHPVHTVEDHQALLTEIDRLRQESPMVADDSVDVIVSNCVLNLVRDTAKHQLFKEMYRVLKRGGRIAISDIVSDEPSPQHLKKDKDLWSGCISGALQEREFIALLEEAGFHGIIIEKYETTPWQIVEGIEYRSITVRAWKGKEGPCIEKNHAVIYAGPWKSVEDDDGHTYLRGERMAVCEKTFGLLTSEPYADHIVPVPPQMPVSEETAFDCSRPKVRDPKETKAGVKPLTTAPAGDCHSDTGCC